MPNAEPMQSRDKKKHPRQKPVLTREEPAGKPAGGGVSMELQSNLEVQCATHHGAALSVDFPFTIVRKPKPPIPKRPRETPLLTSEEEENAEVVRHLLKLADKVVSKMTSEQREGLKFYYVPCERTIKFLRPKHGGQRGTQKVLLRKIFECLNECLVEPAFGDLRKSLAIDDYYEDHLKTCLYLSVSHAEDRYQDAEARRWNDQAERKRRYE